MTVSLLDLLSCGLAVVVILLMLSLNSGMGSDDKLEQAQFIEITVHNARFNNFILTYKGEEDTIEEKDQQAFHYLDFNEQLDSAVGISVTRIDKPGSKYGNFTSSVIQISIPPKASGMELDFDIIKNSPKDKYAIEYSATNALNESGTKVDSYFPNESQIVFKLNYLNGSKATLQSDKNVVIHSFPNLSPE